MIQQELTKLADEADEEDGEDAEKDATQSAGEVEAWTRKMVWSAWNRDGISYYLSYIPPFDFPCSRM